MQSQKKESFENTWIAKPYELMEIHIIFLGDENLLIENCKI